MKYNCSSYHKGAKTLRIDRMGVQRLQDIDETQLYDVPKKHYL